MQKIKNFWCFILEFLMYETNFSIGKHFFLDINKMKFAFRYVTVVT